MIVWCIYTVNRPQSPSPLNCQEECAPAWIGPKNFPSLRILRIDPSRPRMAKRFADFEWLIHQLSSDGAKCESGEKIFDGLTKTRSPQACSLSGNEYFRRLWTVPSFPWIYVYLTSCLLHEKSWWFRIFGIQVSIFCLPKCPICLLRLFFLTLAAGETAQYLGKY